MRAAFIAALSILSVGCVTTPSGPIRGSDTPETRAAAIARELRARGYQCSVDKAEALCESEGTYKMVLNTSNDPARLFIAAYFGSKQPCSNPDLQARIAAANREHDVQVACIEREKETSLSFGTLTLIPRAGVTPDELDSFLQHFSQVTAGAIKKQNLKELLE